MESIAEPATLKVLAQIEEKKYEAGIIARGINDIEKLGFVFDGKKVWVRKAL